MRKTAIITGGGSGIGRAIAEKFVSNELTTVLVGRNEERLKKSCEELGSFSDYIRCDLSELEEIPGMVKEVADRYGQIDILVNNAGINYKKDVTEVTDEEYGKVILTNQTAVFALTRTVAGYMLKKGKGSVLNISSMASRYGIPYVIAYTASKAAVEGMTRALAVELSPSGIRVNCIAPGFIKTDMSDAALNSDPERKGKVFSRTPMGRLGKPEEVAEAALFLVSDAASYITGVILPVDGGNSIGF